MQTPGVNWSIFTVAGWEMHGISHHRQKENLFFILHFQKDN